MEPLAIIPYETWKTVLFFLAADGDRIPFYRIRACSRIFKELADRSLVWEQPSVKIFEGYPEWFGKRSRLWCEIFNHLRYRDLFPPRGSFYRSQLTRGEDGEWRIASYYTLNEFHCACTGMDYYRYDLTKSKLYSMERLVFCCERDHRISPFASFLEDVMSLDMLSDWIYEDAKNLLKWEREYFPLTVRPFFRPLDSEEWAQSEHTVFSQDSDICNGLLHLRQFVQYRRPWHYQK